MRRRLSEIQNAFSTALLDPGKPVPGDVLGRDNRPDARRFAVYRNNVIVGLIDALRARFPVTERIVGEEFFRAMARAFAITHKPRSPLLMCYGDEFPDFIEDFEPAGSVPYLRDMARLEVAWTQAYHAAEAVPLDIPALDSIDPEELLAAHVHLHPSVRLARSDYPITTIWAAHQRDGGIVAPESWEAEDVLVLRPDAEVLMHRLPPGGHAFISALLAGGSLEAAGEAGLEATAVFDLGENLIALFRAGAACALACAYTREATP